jgi:hypothetical protein
MAREPWYVQDRAETLARVFLTTPGVATLSERSAATTGVDFVLAVTPGARVAPFEVAVQVKGYDGEKRDTADVRPTREQLADAKGLTLREVRGAAQLEAVFAQAAQRLAA